MKTEQTESLALELMSQHGLLERGWTFSFDRAKRRYGCCHYSTKTITVSKALSEINSLEQTKDTILHEIAHALVGTGVGHGREWKYKAFSIGAKPERCYSSKVEQPSHRWNGTCPNGHVTKRFKRMKLACAKCCTKYNHGRYTVEFAFVWTENK